MGALAPENREISGWCGKKQPPNNSLCFARLVMSSMNCATLDATFSVFSPREVSLRNVVYRAYVRSLSDALIDGLLTPIPGILASSTIPIDHNPDLPGRAN